MRIYDPRLGKFLSVDPLTRKYPELTPYQFSSNNPVRYIDLDGLEQANPLSYIWSGFGDGFIGIANWFDNTLSLIIDETITTPVSSETKGGTTLTNGTETKTTSETTTNFAGILTTLKYSQAPVPMQNLPDVTTTTTTTTTSAYTQVDVKTTNGEMTNKTTSNQVETKNETSASQNTVIEGVPVNVKISASNTTTGKTEVKAQASTPSGPYKIKASATYGANLKTGKKNIKIGIGGEIKSGNSTISTESSVKIKVN